MFTFLGMVSFKPQSCFSLARVERATAVSGRRNKRYRRMLITKDFHPNVCLREGRDSKQFEKHSTKAKRKLENYHEKLQIFHISRLRTHFSDNISTSERENKVFCRSLLNTNFHFYRPMWHEYRWNCTERCHMSLTSQGHVLSLNRDLPWKSQKSSIILGSEERLWTN